MASILFASPRSREFSSAGTVLPGAKLYFYVTGTTTPATVYQNAARTVAHSSPILADTGGLFPAIWLTASQSYDVTLKTSAGATVWSVVGYSEALTAAEVGLALYPKTAAESSAGVTPVSYSYPPGYALRYGAATTGDNSVALQAAINVAQQDGGTAVFPSFPCPHSTQLVVTSACTIMSPSRPGPRVYSDPLTAYGGAELIYTAPVSSSTSPGSFAIKVDTGTIGAEGNAQVKIQGLGISWTDKDAGGIYVEGASRVLIDDVWFCGGKTFADAGTLTGIGIYARDMIISKITNCRFNYVAYGIIGDDYFNENSIEDCDFEYVTQLPIGIFSVSATSLRNTIRGNNFIGLGVVPCDTAIWIAGDVQQTSINENTFEVIRKHTIRVDKTNPLTLAALGGSPLGISVKENTFAACGGGIAGSTCLNLQAGAYFTFADNTVKSASGPMTALVNIGSGVGPVFILRNSPDAVPALWAGNLPTFVDAPKYRSLPLDSGEAAQASWNNDNLGAMWVNSNTSGGNQRALRYWNGSRSVTIKTLGVRTDATSDTTPEVRGISTLLANPAGTYTITYFDEGYTGQTITVYNQSAFNVTIDCTGTNIKSKAGTDIVLGAAAWRKFELIDGTVWVEV